MAGDLLRFHHVGLVVQNLEASMGWYARHLGFERESVFAFPGARAAFIARGDVRLELFQVEGAAPMALERKDGATNLRIGGINHLAIAVDDLDRTVAELAEDGVDIARPPAVSGANGARFAFIRDNEGMLLELFQPA